MKLRRQKIPPLYLNINLFFFIIIYLNNNLIINAKSFSSSALDVNEFDELEFIKSANEKSSKNVKHLLTDIDTKCPEDWHHLDNKCYRGYTIERSWPQALSFCFR